MIDAAFAQRFAAEWIAAWNRHDLDAILAHYADDFEMASPLIPRLAGEPSGRLRGKRRVGAYWARALTPPALTVAPRLRFELIGILTGVDSVALHYRSGRGPAVEVFEFAPGGKVIRAAAHYLSQAQEAP
ncbi:MAG: nuclear transport factor 2 family protein [Pseudomonadota bacterium]|nr:nuclear transport factor 2 family protein [Candidatus Acidoferrales bacterium]